MMTSSTASHHAIQHSASRTTATILFVVLTVLSSCVAYSDASGNNGAMTTQRFRRSGNKNISVNVIPGILNKLYSEVVKKDEQFIFSFTWQPLTPKQKTVALRLYVSSTNASGEYPVLFVVRQQTSILSWQVPLYLQNVYDYYTVSRTLCPVQGSLKKEKMTMYLDVSSSSLKATNFVLRATPIDDFQISTNDQKRITVSPSEPKYYMYEFPEHLDSVVVKVTSNSSLCTVISIQDIHCPVFDLDRNVQFTGTYQTMTKTAALTLMKKDYKDGIFYIVFVVKPSDFDCNGIEFIQPIPDLSGKTKDARIKELEFSVTPTISVNDYYIAVFGAVAWFLMFYVAAIVIHLIHCLIDKRRQAMGNEFDPADPKPDVPIVNTNPRELASYGTTSPTDANFERDANGIPHRIPPPDDDDSSIDETDIDMLNDADSEKEIIRTKKNSDIWNKTLLYVSDLARKDRRILAKKYKLYHWNLITIAIFYGLPVIQLVITYQKVLHATGDEDICYYNFLCAHPLGVLSAFNNVFSNIGYIMLGILFLGLTWRRDILHKRAVESRDQYEQYYGIPQHFGLFYAMGMALVMVGILSGCYHVCPSYSNFQFDTSFMYMIALLCMLKIYQTRHPDINATAHSAYFALALIIFLAVIGVVYGTTPFWVFYGVAHMILTLTLSIQIYYMGRWRLDCGIFKRLYLWIKTDLCRCGPPLYPDRMILLIIGNLVNISFALFGMMTQPRDFASYLLAIFIVNLLLYCAFYIIMKLRSGERILLLPLLYILVACVVWGFAFYFFVAKLTSWEISPAESRTGNQDCILFEFYDAHDVWHGLSAMGLFFSFMILLSLDDDLVHTPRDRIPVF
ncbi:SID1 transmembrane family member 1-like isoform X2 [Tubulanus polymorphus]|uniref:SID1 transmembrane family member 1-like isoform X2 n=1 Tax=Tubulanus polymorphus TaxID=672921 RepID=UPI003DA20325